MNVYLVDFSMVLLIEIVSKNLTFTYAPTKCLIVFSTERNIITTHNIRRPSYYLIIQSFEEKEGAKP